MMNFRPSRSNSFKKKAIKRVNAMLTQNFIPFRQSFDPYQIIIVYKNNSNLEIKIVVKYT